MEIQYQRDIFRSSFVDNQWVGRSSWNLCDFVPSQLLNERWFLNWWIGFRTIGTYLGFSSPGKVLNNVRILETFKKSSKKWKIYPYSTLSKWVLAPCIEFVVFCKGQYVCFISVFVRRWHWNRLNHNTWTINWIKKEIDTSRRFDILIVID